MTWSASALHNLSFELAVRPGESSGGITRRETPSFVVWSDFGYENTYEDPEPFELGPFEFDRPTYESTIRRLSSDCSRLTSGQA